MKLQNNIGNCDIHGNNLIFDAVANGNIEIITKVGSFKTKLNINQINEKGSTILHKELFKKQ